MADRALILDTDGGVDDAQALLLLIANDRTPTFITTVFGNVDLEAATANILATLATVGVSVPVHKGADRPLNQAIIDARHVHGEDGLGGAPRPEKTGTPASSDAVATLGDTFRDAARRGDKVDILMIGPVTNLALALRLDPGIIAGIGQLTLMGGTVYGRGNTTPAAEFNIYADPEAAHIVFGADIETMVVPWEPCTTHLMTGEAVDRMFESQPSNAVSAFSKGLSDHVRQGTAGRGHGDVLRFVDPLAAGVVVDPSMVTKSIRASVDVALAPGIARGMTVVDPSGRLGTPRVTLVEEVDIDRITALYTVSVAYTQ